MTAAIIDDPFGRPLRVVDPDGVPVQVDEAMSDDYGYTQQPTITYL